MKKPNKETLIEIIGAIILLALIVGTVSCNTVCPYDPYKPKPRNPNDCDSNIVLDTPSH